MRLRMSAVIERVQGSLFFVPMAWVVFSIALAQGTLAADAAIGRGPQKLPLGLGSTVESARAVLGTVASATMTVAGVAFSISLLIIQLASSQYSPRIVHGLFRDRFNKRVMGLVVGTFTYCLVVLRAVRSPLDQSGTAVVPNISVAVAVILGIATVLGVVAFINHSAHSMNVSELLDGVVAETVSQMARTWSDRGDAPAAATVAVVGESGGFTVRSDGRGWVKQVDGDALLACLPPGATVRVDITPGRYAIRGAPLCTAWPAPDDPASFTARARRSFDLGRTRTMQQDVSYGLRQVVDVALKALSPGVNDPTTAQEAIFHASAIVAEGIRREPPPRHRVDGEGRHLILPGAEDRAALIRLAFDEVREAAAPLPAVCRYLLEAIHLLKIGAVDAGDDACASLLDSQARLVLAGARHGGTLPEDLHLVEAAYRERFGEPPTLT
ncbi:MAG TPA: DUF2254 domain-containing protein [Acidimicrobiales bacterium]|nr:DUF2254 domain-containing protein [Acidimicrobiales bacterium]